MFVVHCPINKMIDFVGQEIKTLFKLEFYYNGGYWSHIYNCDTLAEAKELMHAQFANAEYKRMKRRNKITTKFW